MSTQVTQSEMGRPNGYFLWLKLKAALAWLKRAVMAMLIAGSFYIGAAQPVPVRAGDYTAGDYATLVAAINNANASPEDDTITLTGNITLGGNLPLIKSDLVFEGAGYSISGNNQYRVFFVGSGSSDVNGQPDPTAPIVVFRNLTIQNGRAQGGGGSGGGAGLGGGLFVYDGDVTVENVTFAGNVAQGGSRGANSGGGGGMEGNGGDFSGGGGGGLWAGANGGTSGGAGGSAGAYGGGGAGSSSGTGGAGGGTSGGAGGFRSGGGGGLNGGAGASEVGGNGGWGGGGGGVRGEWPNGTGGNGGFGGGGGGGWTIGAGAGGFGGGGGSGDHGGNGGFGGGGGWGNYSGAGGFGGSSAGGGAGLGGGLFIRTGVLTMTTVAFNNNTATGGAEGGQGLGGGLFVLHTLTNANGNNQGMPATLPSVSADSCSVTFSGNAAANDAGTSTDNDNVFGDLAGAASPCGIHLDLNKSVTPDTNVLYQDVVTYTLALVNTGAESDSTVILTDTLPTEVAFDRWIISPTGTLRVGNAITWTGAVAAEESLTWMFRAAHNGAYGDVITNTAHFSGSVQTSRATAVVAVKPFAPDLTLAKTVTPTGAAPGQPVTYTLAFSNTGYQAATDVVLTDTFPISVTHPSISSSGAAITLCNGTRYVWDVADLASGAGGMITITGVLSMPLPAEAFTNTAAIATAVGGDTLLDNTDAAAITVLPAAPAARDNAYATEKNTTLVVSAPGVLANDADPNGDAFFSVLATDVLTGVLDLDASGAFTYTPPLDWSGAVTFTYQAAKSGVPWPLAHLKLEEGSGTVAYDASGHAHHATLTGTTWTATTPVIRPPSDFALHLDGVDDYAALPASFLDTADFTFAAWVYWRGGNVWQRVFDFGQGKTQYMFLSPMSDSNTLRFAITSGAGEQRLNTSSLATNQWVHVAVTLEGDTGRLWVNGAAVDTQSITLNPHDIVGANNWLGRSQWPDPYLNADLDDVRVYDVALTAAEIATLAAGDPLSLMSDPAEVSLTVNPHAITVTLPVAVAGAYPFGAFCGGVTFTDTNGVTVITATFVYSYPSVSGSGLPRQYTLAANGSGFQAAVTLCYDDHDLLSAGIAPAEEENLHAYRYIGAVDWQQYSRVDTVANTVTADNVTQFGVFGLGVADDKPTALTLGAFAIRSGAWGFGVLSMLATGIVLARRKKAQLDLQIKTKEHD